MPANDEHASTLTVNFPPDATAGQWAAANGMVQVKISSQRDEFFGGIFGGPSASSERAARPDSDSGNTKRTRSSRSTPTIAIRGMCTARARRQNYSLPLATQVTAGYVQVNSDCGIGRRQGMIGAAQGPAP